MIASHTGDLGDLIWGLAALRIKAEDFGHPIELHLYQGPGPMHPMTAERAELILPLLRLQDWLQPRYAADPVQSAFAEWRKRWFDWRTIAGLHLGALGYGRGAHTRAVERIWLAAPDMTDGLMNRSPELRGRRIVFARSSRYLSHDFPWTEIVDWLGKAAVFVGLEGEYAAFIRDHPRAAAVPWVPTSDLCEAAQIIGAADLVVSNQTSLFALAEALKKPRVLETWLPLPNCEYGSRNCLAIHPGMKVTPERIMQLLQAPFTV